ncbi:MAG: beta-ketoacyl synthase N-terminal-like domain-containing protein, partial [Acidobacteriota bacterium]
DFSNTVGNAAASLCGIEFGLRGPNVTLSYKEGSALAAVHYAASLVRTGRARAVVSGGVDDVEGLFFAVHDQFGVLASDAGDGEASRPFDRRRDGVVVGNGAFLLVIEQTAAAADRRAAIAGYIEGVGATSSSCALNDWPDDPAHLEVCMRAALADAGRTTEEVGVVFASANSTPALDRVEAAALAAMFGPAGVPVVALKGALGECGAAGGAAVIAAAISLRRGWIPPTVGFREADPDCPVDVAPVARAISTRRGPVALVNSFASGGGNFCVVVGA